jgi:hypothetical protein
MIKFVFRWLFRLLVLAIVLTVAAVLLKDTIIKSLTASALSKRTGLEVRIGQMEVGLMTPTVTMERVVIYNSAEFGGAAFLEIPELHFRYDLHDARRRVTHLELLRLHIHEINVVESDRGKTNLLEVLNRVVPGGFGLGPIKGSGKIEHFKGIDTLNLTVDRVKYLSLRNPRHNQDVEVGIKNDLIQNTRTQQDIAAIVMKIFLRAGITIFHDSPVRASTNRTIAPMRAVN